MNYFVLFFNVLDLYIFLLNDIDVITSKKQTWKVIKVFIIIITIIIIAMFETQGPSKPYFSHTTGSQVKPNHAIRP